MSSKIDRIGETGINNFGNEMIIVNSYIKFNDKYKRNYTYIDVYFQEYNWTFKDATYSNCKKGNIKCPYERRVYGVGYLGEGKYKSKENGKTTRLYHTWQSMLQRCYDAKYHKRQPTYIDCEVCEEWLNFQNFGKWYDDNFYEVEGERMHLDKDILFKHNKTYSAETCIFVPQTINSLFIKTDKSRGEYPIGVSLHRDKYIVHCHLINPKTGKSKQEHLGVYNTQEKAFEVYKYYKEKNIKEVADYYKDEIPERLYDAMYNYEVDIDD